ncbi:MAG: hypothetical protein U0587_07990 [Candidatus Binatia bacterium]
MTAHVRTTRYLVALTLMWGALSFQWTVLVNNVVPTRVLLFATENTKGQWLGLVTLVGAVFYMLTARSPALSRCRAGGGRRRPAVTLADRRRQGDLCPLGSLRAPATVARRTVADADSLPARMAILYDVRGQRGTAMDGEN